MGTACTPFYLPTKAEEVLKRIINPLRILSRAFFIADPVLWVSSDYRIGVMLGIVTSILGNKLTIFYGDGVEREYDSVKNPKDTRLIDSFTVSTGIQVLYNIKANGIYYYRGDRVITNVFQTRDLGTVLSVLDEDEYGKAVSVELDTGEVINQPMSNIVLVNDGFAIENIQSFYNI